jgi:hypothetical protein
MHSRDSTSFEAQAPEIVKSKAELGKWRQDLQIVQDFSLVALEAPTTPYAPKNTEGTCCK